MFLTVFPENVFINQMFLTPAFDASECIVWRWVGGTYLYLYLYLYYFLQLLLRMDASGGWVELIAANVSPVKTERGRVRANEGW